MMKDLDDLRVEIRSMTVTYYKIIGIWENNVKFEQWTAI